MQVCRIGESQADRKARLKVYLANYYRTHKSESVRNAKAWKKANPEKVLISSALGRAKKRAARDTWRLANADIIADEKARKIATRKIRNAERVKKWKRDHPQRMREIAQKCYRKYEDKLRINRAIYKKKHRASIREKGLVYTKANREKLRLKSAIYYATNTDKAAVANKKWREAHPERCRIHGAKRRAKVANTPIGNLETIASWEKAWRSKEFVRCFWCEQTFPARKCHSDHIVAIKHNGEHCVENLCISCKPCNLKKNAKPLERWNSELAAPVLI